MIACIDVGYSDAAEGSAVGPHGTVAHAACVCIDNWRCAESIEEHLVTVHEIEDYQSGEFYRRELPCIQAVLAQLETPPDCIVIDGYVWLGSEPDSGGNEQRRPGLGAYLYESLERPIPVIGVAKNPFKDVSQATPLSRGASKRPLYITAIGIPIAQAVVNVIAMHGSHRLPTILKRADRLSRGSVKPRRRAKPRENGDPMVD